MWHRLKRIANGSSTGQAVVESALVLPVLIAVLVGTLELGRAAWTYSALAHSAREGTRYAGIHGINSPSPVGPGASSYTAPNTDTTITDLVQDRLVSLDPAKVTVLSTWPDGDSLRGSQVRVEVRYLFEPIVGAYIRMPTFTMASVATGNVQY